MKTYNVSPYFDDFDEFKDYHQVMFKPGYAIQARELTQMQTILRNQIEKFGNHIFKHGQIVIPGNSFAKLGVDYVTVTSAFNGLVVDNARFINKTIVGATQNAEATIIAIEDEVSSALPKTFYVSYTKAGTYVNAIDGFTYNTITFLPDEEVYVKTDISARTFVRDTLLSGGEPAPIGKGQMAFVNEGVYYINGTFVSTTKQSVVIDRYGVTPSCHVLFKITEQIVDYTDDESLLDNSQGSSNYTAPGADRVKISIDLVTLNLNTTVTSDYVELMRYNEGVLEEHARFPKYNELEKSLARRTYEESGNYVVEGLRSYAQEYLRANNNRGKYPLPVGASIATRNEYDSKLVYNVHGGKAYIEGFGVETLVEKQVEVLKPRTAIEYDRITKRLSYGSYVLINVTTSEQLPAAGSSSTVEFWNTSSGGAKIATAKFITVDYYTGQTWGDRRIDKMYFYDLQFQPGFQTLDVASRVVIAGGSTFGALAHEVGLDSTSTWAAVVTSTVVLDSHADFSAIGYDQSINKLYIKKSGTTGSTSLPVTGTVLTESTASSKIVQTLTLFNDTTDNLVQYLGRAGIKALKDRVNLPDMDMTTWEKLEIGIGSTVQNTVTSGTIVGVDEGILTAYTKAGAPAANSLFQVSGGGTSITAQNTAGYNLYVQVRKSAVTPKTKTVATSTISTGATFSQNNRRITLPHYDVVFVESVVINGVDRINDFKFYKNTSEFAYNNSYLEMRPGISGVTTVTSYQIKYTYLAHSGTSSFFAADSYENVPSEYVEKYTPQNGDPVSLRDCIDLRYTATTYPIVSGSSIDTSVQYYLGRIDLVCMDKNGKIFVEQGIPAKAPRVPVTPVGAYALDRYDLPPYVHNVSDIKYYRMAVDTYTMEKISNIEERIDRIEEFTTLSVAETQLLQTKVIDAQTGLEKYKTGYLVENVQDPFEIADVLATGYSASTSPDDGIYCRLENESINLTLYIPTADDKKISVKDGGFVTLAYSQQVFAQSQYSSKIVNVNPFNVVAFEGTMTIEPKQDYWVETLFLPEVTLRKSAWAWTIQPAAIPPAVQDPIPTVPPVVYAGTKYTLPNNAGDAYYSGPSEISIDTIMGWDSATRHLSTWEYPNIQQYIRNGLNLR